MTPNIISRLNLAICDILFLLRRRTKGFYVGWTGYGNLGDEILFAAINTLLSHRIVFYNKPYISRLLGVFLQYRRPPFDCLVVGGGTLINKSNILTLSESIDSPRKFSFGCGVANPSFWASLPDFIDTHEKWTNHLNTFDYVSVRGPISKQLLIDWGITRPVHLIGDPALYFCDKVLVTKSKRKILGVNLGISAGKVWGGSENQVLIDVVRELTVLKAKGWAFKFFPIWRNDLAYILEAAQMLGENKPYIVMNYLNLNNFLSELRSVDVFVGEKLHAVILAACTYTPIIMIEYRPKCYDFMASFELENNNIRCDRIEPNSIVERVESEYTSLYDSQALLREKALYYQAKITAAAINILELC
jgi:polysaccharide pyruvyl transferase WcaK-like protein